LIIQLFVVIDDEVGLIHGYVFSHGIRLLHLVALATSQDLIFGVFPDVLGEEELLLLGHLLIAHMILEA
jgi:hypothetical protein